MGVQLHGTAILHMEKRRPIGSWMKAPVCLTYGLVVLAKRQKSLPYHKSCSTVTILTDLTRLLILAYINMEFTFPSLCYKKLLSCPISVPVPFLLEALK